MNLMVRCAVVVPITKLSIRECLSTPPMTCNTLKRLQKSPASHSKPQLPISTPAVTNILLLISTSGNNRSLLYTLAQWWVAALFTLIQIIGNITKHSTRNILIRQLTHEAGVVSNEVRPRIVWCSRSHNGRRSSRM
ncbi:hypothetical protein E2C01_001279 [Portunus trituberculatus]|uniref:Uncharacterized protein n=1 Tax=Portunus trituberculatus TaxID=210409 RepID=A0A5B7CK08_PORTR|nr:hypothetical protein [Portunus trituberculatus]